MMTNQERIDRLTEEVVHLRTRLDSLERDRPVAARSATSGGRTRSRLRTVLGVAGLALVPLVAWAVDVPYVFTNGSLADANQVNANFAALEAAVEAHVADTTIHHPQLTSINGLAGGTITGNVTVSGIVTTTEIQGTPLKLSSPTTVEVNAGTVARINGLGTIDLNGGTITLN